MKKNIFFALSIIATFSFAACSKTELSNQKESSKTNFSIVAGINSEITKTTNDGLNTKWAAGDNINLFHAKAGETEYSSNDEFTISEEDLTSGTFKGTLTEVLDDSNDWYAMYPYVKQIVTPANNSNGWVYIGCNNSHTTAQVQNGNGSMAHLAGKHFPLVATAKNIAKNDPVSLTFSPILSVVKFHVTNNTSTPLTVSTISLTAQEDIVGCYYINFAESVPVFTASGSSYVSKTAKLSVTDGAEIAAESSADFYLAIKPFSNTAGKKLTFSVNAYEKTTTSAFTFAPGKIKTVNFSCESKELEAGTYVALIHNSETSYYAMSSTDDGASTKRFKSKEITYDGSGKYSTTDASIVWNVTKDDSGYLFENGGNYVSWPGSGNSAVMSSTPYYLNVTANGNYFNVSSVNTSSRILSKNSSNAYFAFYDLNASTQKPNFIFIPAELITTPVIEPITAPNKVAAAGATGVEVSYTITNPVEGKSVSAVSAETWVKNFNYATEGKITFDVEANTGSERTSEITVSYEGAADVKFTVTQSGSAEAKTYTWTLTSGQLVTAGGTYTSESVTWTYGAMTYLGFDNTKGAQIGSSNNVTESFNINTNHFGSKTIKSISVNASTGSKGDAKLSIKVGGVAKLTDQALTPSAITYNVDNINASGKVEIVFSATAKAYYLKSISIEYFD